MRILIVDDESTIRKTTALAVESMDHTAVQASEGTGAKKILQKQDIDAVFLDLKLENESGLDLIPEFLAIQPGLKIIVFTAYSSLESAVEAIKRGAYDYIPKPFTPEQVRQIFKKIEKLNKLEGKVAELESRLAAETPFTDFTTTNPALQRVYEIVTKAAATSATILIMGESGTGKSLLARAIHQQSGQKETPFVTVNCPSLSRELLESELFGHVKGAFTGAIADTKGKVTAAEGGMLFLDEIGELPLEIQPKLLRLLQEREYERVGDPQPRKASIRVIAATNRKLDEAVKEGKFREDLYYRLNGLTLNMPPLRERSSDLLPIAQGYLRSFAQQCGRKIEGFDAAATKLIQGYSWPGNLRELRNAIERAVILSSSEYIQAGDLPDQLQAGAGKPGSLELGALVSVEDLEKEHIRHVMAKTASLEEAASVLGIDAATLYRKRKKFNLD